MTHPRIALALGLAETATEEDAAELAGRRRGTSREAVQLQTKGTTRQKVVWGVKYKVRWELTRC